MLGFYENFPSKIHSVETFISWATCRRLQQRIIQALFETNTRMFILDQIAPPAVPGCTAMFEFGIADSESFVYIDGNELKQIMRELNKKDFKILDFFCAVRYYKGNPESKKPLRFDYYFIRMRFAEKAVELQLVHERGPRYLAPQDFTRFIVDRTNGESTKRILKTLKPAEHDSSED